MKYKYLANSKNITIKTQNILLKIGFFHLLNIESGEITRLDGGKKLQVFNTVAYPNFDSEMPILGADILWFGTSQKLLAILDYQPLIQESKYPVSYTHLTLPTNREV